MVPHKFPVICPAPPALHTRVEVRSTATATTVYTHTDCPFHTLKQKNTTATPGSETRRIYGGRNPKPLRGLW